MDERSLNEFWQASFELEPTVYVVRLLIGLFVVGFLALWGRYRFAWPGWKALAAITPSTLATVGVIGTFFGIWVGLQDFDVRAIDASVPALLDGLKTAFVTSLWGMALSVIYRLVGSCVPARSTGTGSVVESLGTLVEEQRLSREIAENGFETLRRAISGDDDGALVAQVGRLRNELRDQTNSLENALRDELGVAQVEAKERHERTIRTLDEHAEKAVEEHDRRHEEHMDELRTFARHMVENTSKSLIDALQSVIDDFNEKLTTQFGENFRELNVAVGRLLEWQERYRAHVEQVEQRVEAALESIERTAVAVDAIERSASSIPDAIEPLEPVLDKLETGLQHLNRDLEAYGELHEKARSALPLVNENLDAMTSGLRASIDQMIASGDEALARQSRSHDALETGYESVMTKAGAAQERFDQAVDETMRRVADELAAAAERMGQDLREGLAETDRRLRQQVETLDRALGEELEKALGTMGKNLGGMSEQFVTDYGPLTQQLRELIESARAANEPRRLRAS